MSHFIITAILTPKPAHRDDVREAALALLPIVHAEEGPAKYTLHAELGGERLVFVEKWSDDPDRPDHLTQPHIVDFFVKLEDWLEVPIEVIAGAPVVLGSPARGEI